MAKGAFPKLRGEIGGVLRGDPPNKPSLHPNINGDFFGGGQMLNKYIFTPAQADYRESDCIDHG